MMTMTTILQVAQDIPALNLREITMISFIISSLDATHLFINHLLWIDDQFIPRLQELHEEISLIYGNMEQFLHTITPISSLVDNLNKADMIKRYDIFQTLYTHVCSVRLELLALDDHVDEMEYMIPGDALELFDRDVHRAQKAVTLISEYLKRLDAGIWEIHNNLLD